MYLVVINFTRSQPFFVSFFNVSFTSTSVLESAAHKLYFFFLSIFFFLLNFYVWRIAIHHIYVIVLDSHSTNCVYNHIITYL